jgi:hypothetical protein
LKEDGSIVLIKKTVKVEIVHFERITIDEDDGRPLASALHIKLDSLHSKFVGSHVIIIERQQPISARGQIHTNSKVMRVFGHICAYFMAHFSKNAFIAEINPKLKGRVLNFPKDLTYAQTKSHSVKVGTEIMSNNRDLMGLEILRSFKSKKDDLTDTVCQLEAFLILYYNIENDKIKMI